MVQHAVAMQCNFPISFRRPFSLREPAEQKTRRLFCHGADASRPLCCLRAVRGVPGLAAMPTSAMHPALCIAPLSRRQTSQSRETAGRNSCPASHTELGQEGQIVKFPTRKNLGVPNAPNLLSATVSNRRYAASHRGSQAGGQIPGSAWHDSFPDSGQVLDRASAG